MANAVKKLEAVETSNLIQIENLDAKEIFYNGGVGGLIEKTRAFYQPKLDSETPEGREERRKLAYAVAKTKNAVDDLGKIYVADLKKVTTAVDAQRKIWRDTIQDFQDEVRTPLTIFENKEKARIETHQRNIQAMRDYSAYDYEPASSDVEERIEKLEEISKLDYQEFSEQATTVYQNSFGKLGEKLAAVMKAEEQAIELAELRKKTAELEQKQREDTIRAEAEQAAKEKLQQEIDAANQRAEVAEQKVTSISVANSQSSLPLTVNPATATPASVDATFENKRTTDGKIVKALCEECLISESAAKEIVVAIAKNKIPNLTINY